MSRKVDLFKSNFGSPLTINNFLVEVPALPGKDGERVSVIVQATSMPQEKLRVTNVVYFGENIGYPAIPENSHRWRVSIPENTEGMSFKTCMKARNLWYEQYSGMLLVPTSLGQTINVKMIDPVTGDMIFGVKLWNAFILGIEPLDLRSDGATTPLILNAEFYYDWIQNL